MQSTKERIMTASATLFRRQGYAGTGLKQISSDAEAPFGSLYHFFPGGKQQLGEETVRWAGGFYAQLIDAFFIPAPDVVSAVERFFAGAAAQLRRSDYADACPIATVALEVANTNEPLRTATAEIFESWVATIATRLSAAGISAVQSRALAISMLCALEGAFVLSRAARTTEALEIVGAGSADAVRAALP